MFMAAIVLPLAAALFGSPLQPLVDGFSSYFNVSLSVAVTLSSGETTAAAAGLDDRKSGTKATTASLYPAGSVTKTFTAVSAMHLAEAGKLDLDMPIHKILDPWLHAQGSAGLQKLWDGSTTILEVTPRQLLQMQGGVHDYDDFELLKWTIENPNKDRLPHQYVERVNKSFLFPPGGGGAYTGVGYVLMGWVLSAASGAASWDKLDQKALVEARTAFRFEASTFMGAGHCSKHPGVVHQYCYHPGESQRAAASASLTEGVLNLAAQPATRSRDICSSRSPQVWYRKVHFKGSPIKAQPADTAEQCCGLADSVQGASYWSFVAARSESAAVIEEGEGALVAPNGGGGTCFYFSMATISGYEKWDNSTSGRVDSALHASDFVDLYDASCLNGWTMGNGAHAPSDLTRFYQALFTGKVVSADSLRQMMDWKPLTVGFSPGTPYGLGLMKQGPIKIPLQDGVRCRGASGCKCILFRCFFAGTLLSHAGLDYGSGFPFLGWIPEVNVSLALASNTGEFPMGMNSSMGVLENSGLINVAACYIIRAAVMLELPTYPAMNCQ